MKKVDKQLVEKYRTPIPKVELAKRLSSKGFLSSMIDITDGLAIDLERLVKFKRKTLGAQIEWSMIPKSLNLEKYFSNKKIFEMVLLEEMIMNYYLLLKRISREVLKIM